jgi:hypothetical protein
MCPRRDLVDRAQAQHFERLVIEPPAVVFAHTQVNQKT